MTDSSGAGGRGSCLCGDISWQVSGGLSDMTHCYCSMCRKLHGTAFVTFAGTACETFCWLSGQQSICHFESSSGMDRPFCGRCGATVPESPDGEGEVWFPVGSLSGDFKERPASHIFVASAAPWYDVPDNLPHYAAYGPGSQFPEVPQPARASLAGKLCGSCQCGGIGYAIEGEVQGIVHCHCSRCRRARAAAHCSNGFTTPSKLAWLRGEELLREYRVPDAERFGQVFCGVCSSPMPRVDQDRDLVVVPAGSFDGDPGVRGAVHIYWGSKATWCEVDDELPRFIEGAPD